MTNTILILISIGVLGLFAISRDGNKERRKKNK